MKAGVVVSREPDKKMERDYTKKTNGDSIRTVQFNEIPLNGIEDPDRTTISNVAKVMMTLHFPKTNVKSWRVETHPPKYDIVVSYPARTPFSSNHISTIEQVNRSQVGDIWIQPENDRVDLIAEVFSAKFERSYTTQQIIIVQRKIEPDNRKRARSDESQ